MKGVQIRVIGASFENPLMTEKNVSLNSSNTQLSKNLLQLLQGFTMDGGRWSNFLRLGMSIPLIGCYNLYDYAKERVMMAKSRKQKESNLLWHALSSMKLTLALLIILAFTSVFGTLIPQQQEAMRFAQGLSPGLLRFFKLLGLFDLYHSLWFRAIIALLALNLVICSINRLPTALKLFRAPSRPDRSKPFENLIPERRFVLKGGIEDIEGRATDCLRKRFRRVEIKSAPERSLLYGEKGRYDLRQIGIQCSLRKVFRAIL